MEDKVGERFIPGTSRITEIESFHRYYAAAELCRGKSVIDVASGEGYGTRILSTEAEWAVGIDLDNAAIEAAQEKYRADNLSFVTGDALDLPFADATFDRVVSYETIEHVRDQQKLLQEIRRVLKPDGILILSSPNKTPFRRRNRCENGENPFHISEIEQSELDRLVRPFFREIKIYPQDAFYDSLIGDAAPPHYYVKDADGNIIRQTSLEIPQYAILLAGNTSLPELPSSIYIDASFDRVFGYQPDDEAVVNQFGLRGEFERTSRELAEMREQHAATENALQQEKQTREARESELAETQKRLVDAKTASLAEKRLREARESELAEARRNSVDHQAAFLAEKQHREMLEVKIAETHGQCAAAEDALRQEREIRKARESELTEAQKRIVDAEAASLTEKRLREARETELAGIKERALLAEAGLLAEKQIREARESELAEVRRNSVDHQAAFLAEKQHREMLENEIADARRAIAAKEQVGRELQNTLQEYRLCQDRTARQLQDCRKSLLETQTHNSKLNSQLLTNTESLQQQLRENLELKSERDRLSRELEDARSHEQTLTADLAERQRRQTQAEQDRLAERQSRMADEEALRNELAAVRNELLTLRQQNAELNGKCANDDFRIDTLDRLLKLEQLKSGGLQQECLLLRQPWWRRLAIRRRIKAIFGAAAAGRIMRAVWWHLPFRNDARLKLKDAFYRRFGRLMSRSPAYREWLFKRQIAASLITEGDNGLILPKDMPLTSIVIPVYNNLDFTRRCLHSIYRIGARVPFEVIVVDDCSTENQEELKREFPQIRMVRNERNSGFLLTANHGAREAKGEYIVFLNNDTEVTPNWLDELAAALYRHPEAGMIGAQLIHMRTGKLQESGNLICRNGEMIPLGRGVDPSHPEFSYFREVDFVSAAGIILRKKVFDEMGGFDTAYAPAYYEDPDLGLRLQRAGYRNYVMPLSRILHLEMASYGQTLNDRCERNRNFFLDRWRDHLAKHALYADPDDYRDHRRFSRERILYIDAEVPMADRGSGGMDAIFFMEYFLKRGYDVVFHGEYTPGVVPKYTAILLRMGVECVYLPHRKIWEYLESCGWTFSWLFISRIYQAQCFDRLLKQYCPQARYIFNTVDLHFVREKLEADLKQDPALQKQAARTKKFELAVARSADATIVISKDEKQRLEDEYLLNNVWHIPQARVIAGRAPNAKRSGAVFIGSAHPPNMDALLYFRNEVLPLLPVDFRLTIVGEALKQVMAQKDEYKALLKCPQYKFVGFVRDLGDVLNTARLTVAPLRYGAGTKGKVASSMSYGVPCVSSDFGVEGTGMCHGENIMLAKTPEEFAQYIRALIDDDRLWRKISDGGLAFLKREYDPEKIERQMDSLMQQVRDNAAHRAKGAAWYESPVIPKQEELTEND